MRQEHPVYTNIAKILVSLARAQPSVNYEIETRAQHRHARKQFFLHSSDLVFRYEPAASHRITAGCSPFFKVTSHRPRSPARSGVEKDDADICNRKCWFVRDDHRLYIRPYRYVQKRLEVII